MPSVRIPTRPCEAAQINKTSSSLSPTWHRRKIRSRCVRNVDLLIFSHDMICLSHWFFRMYSAIRRCWGDSSSFCAISFHLSSGSGSSGRIGPAMAVFPKKKSVEPKPLSEPLRRGIQNVPWPTPLSGRGNQGTASVSGKGRSFSLKQRLDARASIQNVTVIHG